MKKKEYKYVSEEKKNKYVNHSLDPINDVQSFFESTVVNSF